VCVFLCLGLAGCASSGGSTSSHGGTETNLTITSISPASGPAGSVVTITGTSFGATQGTSTVSFNGTPATPSSWSASSITVTVPTSATTGSVLVTVGTAVSNSVTFTVFPAPSITSLSPTSGPVGTNVTITGTNFGSTTGTVTFNGTAATPTNWSATSITVPVPTGASTGNVVVTASAVASNGVAFTVLATPSITSLNPTSGPVGTMVTITGTNFGATQGTSTVTFNATAGTPTSWSATSITVPVPTGATTGSVIVTVAGVASNGVSFTVLATPTITNLNPTSGAAGTSVTITGTNFGAMQGTSTVTFNGTAGTPSAWSATSITVPVPAGATTGNVVVTVSGVASGGVNFTVLPTPNITNLNPTSGLIDTPVTITGTNFGATEGSSSVKFNGTAGTPTNWSDTSITVPVPSGATTGNVVVTVNGVPSNGVTFTVTVIGITSISPTVGVAGDTVIVTGTDFGATPGTSTIKFNGTAATPTSWSDTSITVTVPVGATTGNVVVTVGGQSSNGVKFTVSASGGPVSDDFHGSTLNSMWKFYAACCGFEKLNGTDLLLVVPSTTNHNIYAANQGVGLFQNVSDTDFEVEAKFDTLVAQGFQEEGIVVQQDANNFIFFGAYSDGTNTSVYSIVTIGGSATDAYDQQIAVPTGARKFYMHVKREGTTWTQTWSTDGSTYTAGASLTQSLVVSAMGPAAGNTATSSQNNNAPSFTAAVDYFYNVASPITPGDGGMAPPANQPVFNVWYGDTQTFGNLGIPQQQVNVLGNVSAPSGIQSLTFTLNGGASELLQVGPNGTRLVDTGDFDVEICIPKATSVCNAPVSLQAGTNTVVLTATDSLNNVTTHTVTVNWSNTGQTWALPYSIDWSTVSKVTDVAQVVDGQWAIQPDGTVRTQQVGYDRLLAIGDVTWTDYKVTEELTVNTFDCQGFSIGVIVGWQGHSKDPTDPNAQPAVGHIFPAFGTYATIGSDVSPTGTLNLYANTASNPEKVLIADTTGITMTPGVKYILTITAQRNSGGLTSHYTLNLSPASGPQSPVTLQYDTDPSTGSVLLAVHEADVSISNVTVTALP
jgi:IPT/TIG domain/Beta xylosidase C-terminal Concanavalin A-like domain